MKKRIGVKLQKRDFWVTTQASIFWTWAVVEPSLKQMCQQEAEASPRAEWVVPDPPLLFRPLLGLAQIRWNFFLHIGGT